MTGLGWMLVEGSSRLLGASEREAVLGDLVETDENAWRGTLDVAGLVARRHVQLWKGWRPWVTAFGVALPCSFQLLGYSLSVSETFRSVVRQGVFASEGLMVGPAVLPLFCRVILLVVWAWTGGFVVGAVSRRTVWASVAACFLPCLFCLSRFGNPSESRFSLLLFLLPAAGGVWHGLRQVRMNAGLALALAVTATVLAVPGWTGPKVLLLALLWPAWFLVVMAFQRPVKA